MPGSTMHVRCSGSTEISRLHCNTAISAFKLARHIVRSAPDAKVLVVCVELCTLHLQENQEDIERLLTFLLFGDGCAAALISAEPNGFALDRFHTELMPEAAAHITWTVRDLGFDMMLAGEVPTTVGAALHSGKDRVLSGASPDDFDLWAVHPGGRTVLDAVEGAFQLAPAALAPSRQSARLWQHVVSSSPTTFEQLAGRGIGTKGTSPLA